MPSSKCPLFVLPQEDAERGIRIRISFRQLCTKSLGSGKLSSSAEEGKAEA